MELEGAGYKLLYCEVTLTPLGTERWVVTDQKLTGGTVIIS